MKADNPAVSRALAVLEGKRAGDHGEAVRILAGVEVTFPDAGSTRASYVEPPTPLGCERHRALRRP